MGSLQKPADPAKPKFAPKIPVKAPKPPPTASDGAAASIVADGAAASGGRGGRGGRGRDGGERGGGRGGRGGRGGARGGMAAGPSIVTFRGTGAVPVAFGSDSGWGGSRGGDGAAGGRYAYSGSRQYKGGASGVPIPGAMGAADAGGDDDEIDVTALPTTLPMTPRPPWDASVAPPARGVDGAAGTAALRKLARSVSRPAAGRILGEDRLAAVLRSER